MKGERFQNGIQQNYRTKSDKYGKANSFDKTLVRLTNQKKMLSDQLLIE